MDIRCKNIRIVESAHPNEFGQMAAPGIVTPNGYFAIGTPNNPLTGTTVRRRYDDLWIATEVDDTISLDHGIEREGRASFTLAPAAMATVYDERSSEHAVTNLAAIATPLDWIRTGHETFPENLTLEFSGGVADRFERIVRGATVEH